MLHHTTKTYGSFGHDKRSHQKKAALTKVKGTLLHKWLAAVCMLECVGAATSLAPKSGAATIDGGSGEASPADGGHRDLVDHAVGKGALAKVVPHQHQERRQLCHGSCTFGYSVQLDSAQPVWQMCCYSDWNRPNKDAPGLKRSGCNAIASQGDTVVPGQGVDTIRGLNPTYADRIETGMAATCCGTPFGQDPSEGSCAALVPSPLASIYFLAPSSTWLAARAYCVMQGGDLVSIHSAVEDHFVGAWMQAHTTSSYPWIGLSTQTCSRGCSGNWAAEYTWSDGTATDYRNPVWGQNDNAPTYGHYYRNGHWGTWCPSCKSEGVCQKLVPTCLSVEGTNAVLNGQYEHQSTATGTHYYTRTDDSMVIRTGNGGWNFCVASGGVVVEPCYSQYYRQGYVADVQNQPAASKIYVWGNNKQGRDSSISFGC